jgi:hypothetical protein
VSSKDWFMVCFVCKIEFNNKRGYNTHLRFHQNCKKFWEEEKKIKKDKRPKIICKLCNKYFVSITNTHLKKEHGITMLEYKNKYGRLHPQDLLDEQAYKRKMTIEKRYLPEEIKELRGKKSLEKRIKIYGSLPKAYCHYSQKDKDIARKNQGLKLKEFHSSIPKEEKERFNKIKLEKRINTNNKKYGVPFPQSLVETKKKAKETNMIKYGETNHTKTKEGKIKIKEGIYKKYGKYSNFFPKFSFESQELFSKIEKKINYKCYYATNGKNRNNEFQVLISEGFTRFLDFYVPALNKWIEFDEKYHKYEKNQEDDSIRKQQILSKISNIQLLRISEKDYQKNPESTLQRGIDFINNIEYTP